MRIGFKKDHWNDADGNPTGGCSTGTGFTISWQNGQLGRGADRKEPNGAFVEDVLDAVRDRIQFYQDSKFACDENAQALVHIGEALRILDERTKEREARAVEGTHKL